MSVEMPEKNSITAPEPTAETAAFWDAADEGRLVLKRCLGTGKAFHPPCKISPFTGRADTDWIEAEGTGEIYALCVSKRQGREHCIAYIALTEVPIVLSALTRCDLAGQRSGKRSTSSLSLAQTADLSPCLPRLRPIETRSHRGLSHADHPRRHRKRPHHLGRGQNRHLEGL